MERRERRGGLRLGPDGKPLQGRPQGLKNRKTLERENAAMAEQLRTRKVSRTDLQVMLEIRDFFMGVAAQEQKKAAEQGRDPNFDLMMKALDLAGAMASKRAPFLHARLNRVTVSDEIMDLSRLNDDELAQLERLRAKASELGSDPGRAGATLQ